MTKNVYICLLLVICSLTACSPSLREAQDVVAQADSLWHAGQMYGVDAGDSATLAHAYETLNVIPFPFREGLGLGSSYAHARYHYGKLLRAKDNPEEAMQAFINATHSCTRDYHILGRVYSNMGEICHLAGDYALSYDIFELSADMFLRNGDTLNYYYALNDMAFELAEQGKKEETLVILSQINYSNHYLEEKKMETRAVLYLHTQQYDSAIYYVQDLISIGNHEPTGMMICAQIYSLRGQKDSAVYYAEQVLSFSNDLYHLNNSLYILTNDKIDSDAETIKKTASKRSDIQKLLEIRRGKMSQASQLLEQDLNDKPNIAWVAAVLCIGMGIGVYVYRKRRQHKLLSQQVDDLISKNDAAIQQHEKIVQEHTEYINTLHSQVEKSCAIMYRAEDFPNNLYWKDFEAMGKLINNNFGMLVAKLQNIYHLSEKEIRLCILVILGNPSGKQLANLLYYGESGIRTYKNRIAQKMGTSSTEMRDFLINVVISEYPTCHQ